MISMPWVLPGESPRRRPRRSVALRARAVAWQGRTALLPGEPQEDLLQALARAGADCTSEELIFVDEEGRLDGVPVCFVWLTRYQEGALPSASRLSEEGGAFALSAHLARGRRSALRRLPVWEGDRGAADAAARWLLAVLDVMG